MQGLLQPCKATDLASTYAANNATRLEESVLFTLSSPKRGIAKRWRGRGFDKDGFRRKREGLRGPLDRRLRPMHRRLLGYVTDPVIRIKMQTILRLAVGGRKGVKWQAFTCFKQQAWFTLGCVASYHLQITPCLQGLLRRVISFIVNVCCGLLWGFHTTKKKSQSNEKWLFLHASMPCMTQGCECAN